MSLTDLAIYLVGLIIGIDVETIKKSASYIRCYLEKNLSKMMNKWCLLFPVLETCLMASNDESDFVLWFYLFMVFL